MWNKLLKQLSLPESYISITLGFLVVLVAGILLYNNFSNPSKTEKAAETKYEESEIKEAINLPANYTVSAGDSLWKNRPEILQFRL